MSAAFAELQSEFNAALGSAQTVSIAGVSYSAIIEEATFDEIMAAGGVGESGGFRVMVAIADLATRPAKKVAIIARGQTLQVLECINTNGVTWTITAALPALEA